MDSHHEIAIRSIASFLANPIYGTLGLDRFRISDSIESSYGISGNITLWINLFSGMLVLRIH